MSVENETNTSNPAAAFQSLLQKHQNDAQALASKLFDDNYQLRNDRRDLRKQLESLQGKVPGEGSVVLTGEKAKAWEAYQAMGKPGELREALDAKSTAETRLATMERSSSLQKVASQHGYQASVLEKLTKDLEVEFSESELDGKKVFALSVKSGDKAIPLQEYAETNWSDFFPALKPETKPTGTRLPAMNSGGKAPQQNPVEAFIKKHNEKVGKERNPLLPNHKQGA